MSGKQGVKRRDSCIFRKFKEVDFIWSVSFFPRRKNLQSLAEHGISLKEAKDAIIGLISSNYYKGPKQDFSRPGEIWEFKKKIGNVVFYIKLKIDIDGNRKVLKCLGFHEDEFAV